MAHSIASDTVYAATRVKRLTRTGGLTDRQRSPLLWFVSFVMAARPIILPRQHQDISNRKTTSALPYRGAAKTNIIFGILREELGGIPNQFSGVSSLQPEDRPEYS